jgi:hypothetical protein
MGNDRVLNTSLERILPPDIATLLERHCRISTVEDLIRAWKNPDNKARITDCFGASFLAEEVVRACTLLLFRAHALGIQTYVDLVCSGLTDEHEMEEVCV